MNTPAETPAQTIAISLSNGGCAVLFRLLSSPGWNKRPREKYQAGKIQAQLEDIVMSQPDTVAVDPGTPGYAAAQLAYSKAIRAWDKVRAPSQPLTELQVATAQACLRHYLALPEMAANRFLAELQEAFKLTE